MHHFDPVPQQDQRQHRLLEGDPHRPAPHQPRRHLHHLYRRPRPVVQIRIVVLHQQIQFQPRRTRQPVDKLLRIDPDARLVPRDPACVDQNPQSMLPTTLNPDPVS
jgi:hypothetical protein